MTTLARDLSARGFTLRSGGALGADSAFAAGSSRSQIFVPWPGYNGLPLIFPVLPAAYDLAARYHPNWAACSRGARALHARNMHIMLGPSLDSPVSIVVCWTPGGAVTGGTGQALRVALDRGIPILNMATDSPSRLVLDSGR